MPPFEELSPATRSCRLARLGRVAAERHGLRPVRVRSFGRSENAIFRVDLEPGGPRDKVVLRVHQPGYQNEATIRSEVAWLQALARDTDMVVPDALPAPDGELVTSVSVSDVPGPRLCTVLSWVDGRFQRRRQCTTTGALVGHLLARLHRHVETFRLPRGFERRAWDWPGLFTQTQTRVVMHESPAGELGDELAQLGPAERQLVLDATRRVGEAMEFLGTGPDAYGLIHADLHLNNTLFHHGDARPIDFDDCGPGHFVYDIATALWAASTEPRYRQVRAAFVEAYREVRPLTVEHEDLIDTFVAGRSTRGILSWATRVRDDPGRAAAAREWIEWGVPHVRGLLDG